MITYTLSPEELAALRAQSSTPISKDLKKPIELKSKQETAQTVPVKGPDKTIVLQRIAAGNTISDVEKSLGLSVGYLTYWIRKWDLVGINPGKARAILNGEPEQEAVKNVPAVVEKVYTQKEVEEIIKRFTLLDEEKDATIKELIKDRDEWEESANGWERDWVEAEKDRDNWKKIATEFQTLTNTATHESLATVSADMVNSPAHYTAGGIEVIDFIIAKLTSEEFTGFCKGNILKYASRANLKGGIEDLRKCRWYVERLLASSDVSK